MRPVVRPTRSPVWQNETLTSVGDVRTAQPLEEILCQLIAQLSIFMLVLGLANTAIIPYSDCYVFFPL